MTSHHHPNKLVLLFSFTLIAALAGCTGMPFFFSPEAAAQQQVLDHHMPEFTVDPATIQVLQTADLAGKKVVLLSFQGSRAGIGQETCLFSYEVARAPIGGWYTGSGGGGCGSNQPDPNGQPFSIGGGKSSGGPNDVAVSEVYGEVYSPEVALVQVTWSDGALQQASVINSSYLILRAGEFDFSKVEALDAEQKVIFSSDFGAAPGKQ